MQMTREEAKTALGDRNILLFGMSKEERKHFSEALDMAISALSAEGEYIKKDDAISKILTEFVAREEKGSVMCACAEVKQTCADILDSLPTYSFPDSAENKGDLISRQAVEKLVWDYLRDGTYENIAFYEHFLDLPTYTFPNPGNKGEWIDISTGKGIFKNRSVKCSKCGNTLDLDGLNCGRGDANYCPNCGADMRGKTK